MISSGTNLVMTVIGFAVSTMFIVFVCTRLICARIQLTASRRSFPTVSGSDLSILERGLHGLDPGLVATFPTNKFSDHLFSSGSGRDTQCTICLSEYQDKDVLRVLPYCGHAFHVTCIDIWLKQHSTCPVCRISLRNSPDRKHIMQPIYSATIRTPQETFELDAYQSPQVGHEYSSSMAIENQRMESIQNDMLITEPAGVPELASTEVNSSTKIICQYVAEEKLMERSLDS